MDKFTIKATRTDEYEIFVDPNVWNEEYRAEWATVFYKLDSAEEVAKDVAQRILRNGSGIFFEGYGHIKTFMSSGYEVGQFTTKDGKLKKILDSDYCEGILIQLITEDDEYEFEVEEKS